jgi:GNAT superfamily N-acetyltransferase
VQTCYVDFDTRSIADLVSPGELTSGWTITRINVPSYGDVRGKGHGTALLKRILADADAEGVELWLEPSPSDGLDYDQLVAWYKRHGFEMTELGYMIRKPRSE